MPQNYYLDTSIWRDYLENRSDRFRPLGEWALVLIHKIISEKNIILYSDFVIFELSKQYSEKQIRELFQIAEGNLRKVEINKTHKMQASLVAKERDIPSGDALHSILARENNAILVTRDKHFLKLLDIIQINKPEELI